MKKNLSIILASLMTLSLVTLYFAGSYLNRRRIDERITLRKLDKIPYGTYVAYHNLKYLFPAATIFTEKHEPGYWESLSNFGSNQAFISIMGFWNADESEMRRILTFVENGNDVFVSTRLISLAVEEVLGCHISSNAVSAFFESGLLLEDSLRISLLHPPFGKETDYLYPGKKFNAYFKTIDKTTTDVLGNDEKGRPNFIRLRSGKGNLYLQLAPLAFSNYFLLHQSNISYYENALSVIRPGVKKVLWDEYYLTKRSYVDPRKKKGWLGVLMNTKNDAGQKPFRAAFWVMMILGVVFVLVEMRRKQRPIPVIGSPRNDSLDFVKTIGRLYFDKGDHKNLCRKMTAYFLEYVRYRYKLPTGTLDDDFRKNLQFKSGMDEASLGSILSFVKYAEDAPVISAKELADFHRQLEAFYNKQ